MAVTRNRDGCLVKKYISVAQYEKAYDDGAGFCIACGERHENVKADVAFAECPTCGHFLVFSASELGGTMDRVLLPNSSINQRGPIVAPRPRVSRGH